MTAPQQDPPLLREVITHRFKKDLRRLRKSGWNLSKLRYAIDLLVRNQPLPTAYRDHALRGSMAGQRACHIEPDWLLVYEKDVDELILVLIKTGTHRDTLGIE